MEATEIFMLLNFLSLIVLLLCPQRVYLLALENLWFTAIDWMPLILFLFFSLKRMINIKADIISTQELMVNSSFKQVLEII